MILADLTIRFHSGWELLGKLTVTAGLFVLLCGAFLLVVTIDETPPWYVRLLGLSLAAGGCYVGYLVWSPS